MSQKLRCILKVGLAAEQIMRGGEHDFTSDQEK